MRIAVLGAGIAGTCTALELAGRGHSVDLYDARRAAMQRASKWTEGKIHLGFVYANDPSGRTAERMLHGALSFRATLGRWIPDAVLGAAQARPFDYLVMRDSLVPPDAVAAHFRMVARRFDALVPAASAPLSVAPGPLWQRLGAAEVERRYGGAHVAAAFRTAEVAVDALRIGRALRRALAQAPGVTPVYGARVSAVEPGRGSRFGVRYVLDGAARAEHGYDRVVNCLWENRAAIDRTAGLDAGSIEMLRHKLGVYACHPSLAGARLPSATLMLGAYGDVVSYGDGRVYLSWYPAGMVGRHRLDGPTDGPATLPWSRLREIGAATIGALDRVMPAAGIEEALRDLPMLVRGGAIVALGRSDIDDPGSELHQRHAVGVRAAAGYVSVDTGKYTLGPMLALEAADATAPAASVSRVAARSPA